MRRPRWIVLGLAAAAPLLLAWGAPGHRLITRAAIDAAELPAWIRDEAPRIAEQSNEADRYRGFRLDALREENNPEHYIDLELLPRYGLTLRTLPRSRYAFIQRMAVAAHRSGDPGRRAIGQDVGARPSFDPEGVGTLPYAIMEHHAKLVSSMNSARILERLGDPQREHQLRQARENVISHMGHLAHFVGDAAQPLHTTIHHHGWKGENPNGYTTDPDIHGRVDGGVLREHRLGAETIAAAMPEGPGEIGADEVWEAVLALIERSHGQVDRLYELERTGDLGAEPGRAFIADRLADAASTLAALYRSAWAASEPTEDQISGWIRYNSLGAEDRWNAPARAAPSN